ELHSPAPGTETCRQVTAPGADDEADFGVVVEAAQRVVAVGQVRRRRPVQPDQGTVLRDDLGGAGEGERLPGVADQDWRGDGRGRRSTAGANGVEHTGYALGPGRPPASIDVVVTGSHAPRLSHGHCGVHSLLG